MPTLAIEGLVHHSDALERRNLVRLAPSVEVSRLLTRVRTEIADGESHDVGLADLPGDVATACLLSVSTGKVTVAITDSADSVVTFNEVKMVIMLDATIKALVLTGATGNTTVSVYDLILGGSS